MKLLSNNVEIDKCVSGEKQKILEKENAKLQLQVYNQTEDSRIDRYITHTHTHTHTQTHTHRHTHTHTHTFSM